MSTPSDVTPKAGGERPRPRPRLTLPVLRIPGGTPGSPSPTMVSIPMTPAGGIPIGMATGPLGMLQVYPNKASEFMFKQFEGFKDFTMNTAKSGLSVGEKIAFWLYNKVRAWSRNWFTHIFLFGVVLTYSVIGALIFVAVEGKQESEMLADVEFERDALVLTLQQLADDPVRAKDLEYWKQQLLPFEQLLIETSRHGYNVSANSTVPQVWSFWNAIFFCGTIYTTIGKSKTLYSSFVRFELTVYWERN